MAWRYVAGVDRLEEMLTRLVPSLGPLEGQPAALSGGITNHNFRAMLGGVEYVVRVHGKDTELLGIDRQTEGIAAQAAAELGIAPELAATLEDCLVTRFVASEPVSAQELAARVGEIARALRRFHDAPLQLPTRFWVPDLLQRYAAAVDASGERGDSLPPAYGQALTVAARIATVLPLAHARPCHNDLLAANIIRARDDGRLLIVDWEYAGMGHPYFDLGNLSVNNHFGDAEDERLLAAYLERPPSDVQRAALKLMRLLSDAREAAWGVVQSRVSELDFDFERYADEHFERLLSAAAQPDFEEWLAAA